jgi:uncharacterized membrane protein
LHHKPTKLWRKMSHIKRVVLSMGIFLFFALSGYGQTAPCPTGTLASVLGTSCSVGRVIFNFETIFSGNFVELPNDFGIISPGDIGFIPILDGDRAGFKLVTNFTDGQTGGGSHSLGFGYSPQGAPGFDIRRQELNMDASVQGTPSDFVIADVVDTHTYPVSGQVFLETKIFEQNGVTSLNRLSQGLFFVDPELLSTGHPFDTFAVRIDNLASGSAVSRINSVTILYTFGPADPPRLAPLTYRNIDLPGATLTSVSNITDSGRTVGSYRDSFFRFHGYVAGPDGSFTTVDVPGALLTLASGLNEHGDIVGSYTDFAIKSHGFLLQNGAVTIIDVPQAIFTIPSAINDQGQIVGEYLAADFTFHGFLLDQGVLTTIDQGPGTGSFADSAAFAINNAGVIGGTFFDPSTFRAYLQKGGTSEAVDVPGQSNTRIEGINNQGDVVGIFADRNFVQHGFLRAAGVFRTVDFPGGRNSLISGINSSRKIVGRYRDAAGDEHSFIAVPTDDDGLDHRPDSSAADQPEPRPDCKDVEWRLQRAKRRDAGICEFKQ